jgi:hypothetical protein
MEVGCGRPLLGDDGHLPDRRERPAQMAVEAQVERGHVITDRFLLDRIVVRRRRRARGLIVRHRVALPQRPVCGFDHGAGYVNRRRRHASIHALRGLEAAEQFGVEPQSRLHVRTSLGRGFEA